MRPTNSTVGFLRSSAGRGFLIFAALSALLSGAVGYGFYYANVRWFLMSTGEQKSSVLQLVDAVVATYAVTRDAHLSGNAPVPAEFRADVLQRFNKERGNDESLRMVMVGPPGREIATPPGDAITAETIRKFAASPKPEPVTFYVHKDGEVLLRTISPSIASQQACVDCHNRIRPQQQQWRLNEVMGAFVAEVRADPVLRRAKLESIAIAVAVFLASSGIGFYISVLQHRQLVRRAEQHRAEAASRAKSSFLANVGHDLRAPLNAIIGFSEIMGGEALGPIGNAKYRDCVDDILRCGQHLQAIIDDILDMSKIQAEALILREDTVDIPATIGACLDLMRPRARDGRVELVNRVPPVLPGFHADAQRVKQIVMNLLSNAVKFTPPAGRVSVDASIQDGALRLTISDTGIGMSAAEVAIALRPFAKIDNALRRKYEGTGLGLPLVAALVQQHGGALKIDSTPGAGTTIRVVFPPERTLAG